MTASSPPATGYVAGRHRIDDYGAGGFRFADMSHRGSILALPSGIRAIALDDIKDILEVNQQLMSFGTFISSKILGSHLTMTNKSDKEQIFEVAVDK